MESPTTITFKDFSAVKTIDGRVCRVFSIDGAGDYAAPQVIGKGQRNRVWQNVAQQVRKDPEHFGFPKSGTPAEQEKFFKELKWTDVIGLPYSWDLALFEAVLTPLDGAPAIKDVYDSAEGLCALQLDCIKDFIDGSVKSRTLESNTSMDAGEATA